VGLGMNIVICGLGYVGATTTACLLKDGHTIVGIDPDPRKLADVAAGHSPVSEPGVTELLTQGVADDRLTVSATVGDNLRGADMVFVCVGTPPTQAGGLDLSQILAVIQELGAALAALPAGVGQILIVVRSTVPPGTLDDMVIPALTEATGVPPGDRYEIAFNPEFLREASAIEDYYAPAKIVIGEREPGITGRLRGLYDAIDAPLFELPFAAAELTKLTDNGFHALKVAFGNEIGRLALDLGVDPQPVMEAFVADRKLNISPLYLRPGGPFGGSCLPKDVRAINALATVRGIDVPVLGAALASNDSHKSFLARRVMDRLAPGDTVLLLGLSFKSDTDDMRESPLVDLAETLIGKGYDLKIHDPDLKGRTLIGANLRYIEERLPHLSRLLVEDVAHVPQPALIILGKPMPAVEAALDGAVPIVDLVRL
jgi:GDP-mannose 6-dehydrogenase